MLHHVLTSQVCNAVPCDFTQYPNKKLLISWRPRSEGQHDSFLYESNFLNRFLYKSFKKKLTFPTLSLDRCSMGSPLGHLDFFHDVHDGSSVENRITITNI